MGGKTSIVSLALLTLGMLAGCGTRNQAMDSTRGDSLLSVNPQEQGQGNLTPQDNYQAAPNGRTSQRPSTTKPRSTSPSYRTVSVPAGTSVPISLSTQMTSATANVGDTWTGTVTHSVVVNGITVIPEGSTVNGRVTAAKSAERGDRAMLDLGLTSIEVDGRSYPLSGSTEAVIAGSTRARNLGAIAGSAAAGALIGRAVGGSGKGALIGGLIGGAVSTGAVAKSKGYQVVLKPGMDFTFTTNQQLAVRR